MVKVSVQTKNGSALFELLLAMLIFGMAALALSGALNQVGMLAIESKEAAHIQAQAHSLLFEYGFGSDLVEGEVELPTEDDRIHYRLLIEPVEMENMEGLVLPDLFKMVVKVEWQQSGQPMQFNAETYRYAPLYK